MAVSIPAHKVILCGEYGAGKSSIFRRFLDNSFVEETGPKSTIGLDNFAKTFTTTDRTIKVELWDTAGIERFATMAASYYQSASAAILCYAVNDRHSFNMLSQHILEIVMNSKIAKIFLCGNKTDLKVADDEQITEDDVSDFQIQCDAVLSGIYQISCQTGEGVHEMFQDIAKVLAKEVSQKFDPSLIQPHKSDTIPEPSKQGCCSRF